MFKHKHPKASPKAEGLDLTKPHQLKSVIPAKVAKTKAEKAEQAARLTTPASEETATEPTAKVKKKAQPKLSRTLNVLFYFVTALYCVLLTLQLYTYFAMGGKLLLRSMTIPCVVVILLGLFLSAGKLTHLAVGSGWTKGRTAIIILGAIFGLTLTFDTLKTTIELGQINARLGYPANIEGFVAVDGGRAYLTVTDAKEVEHKKAVPIYIFKGWELYAAAYVNEKFQLTKKDGTILTKDNVQTMNQKSILETTNGDQVGVQPVTSNLLN